MGREIYVSFFTLRRFLTLYYSSLSQFGLRCDIFDVGSLPLFSDLTSMSNCEKADQDEIKEAQQMLEGEILDRNENEVIGKSLSIVVESELQDVGGLIEKEKKKNHGALPPLPVALPVSDILEIFRSLLLLILVVLIDVFMS
jgi:hypothetical protein